MPSLEEIEEFKSRLNSLGNEPEILSERGESIEDVQPPEADDLSSLLDGLDLEDETPDGAAGEDLDISPDTGAEDLGDFGLDTGAETPESSEGADQGADEGADERDEALSELFDGLDIPEGPDDLTGDDDEGTAGEADDLDSLLDEVGAPTAEEEPADDFDDIDALLAEFTDEEPDEAEAPADEATAEAESPSDTDDLGSAVETPTPEEPPAADEDFDDFDVPDIFDEEEPAAEEIVAEDTSADEVPEVEDASDAEDLSDADELSDVDEDAGFEVPEIGDEAAEGGFDLPEMEEDASAEEFDLSDLETEVGESEDLDDLEDIGGLDEFDEIEDLADAEEPGDLGTDLGFEEADIEAAEAEEAVSEGAHEDLGGEDLGDADLEDLGGEDAFDLDDLSIDNLGGEEDLGGEEALGGEEEVFDLDDLGGDEFGDADITETDLGEAESMDGEEPSFDMADLDEGEDETETAEELPDLDELGEDDDFSMDDLSAENLFTADATEEAEDLSEIDDEEPGGIDDLMEGEDEFDLGSDLETDDISVTDEDVGEDFSEDLGEDSGDLEIGDLSVPDEFSLEDDSGLPAFDETAEAEPGGDERDESLDMSDDLGLEDDELGLGDDDFEVDEFDLGDLGEQFGILEDAGEDEEEFAEGPAIDLPSGAELPSGDIELEISEEEFEQVRRTLETLPRNLKIAIEELIAETGAPPADLKKLLDALASGASPRDLANLYTKITGKKIQIPTQYEKRTGEEFEEEKGTLAYAFRQNILPMLRVFLAAAAGLALLIFLGYNFVYRPLYAASLYNTGYEEVMEDRYRSGNGYFEQAFATWRDKDQFYRYADGFTQRGQYEFASRKYEELDRAYPDDRRGILEHARLQRDKITDYERAEGLLQRLLQDDMGDTEAMLELGDTYLEWGDEEPEKYEDARFWYAEYRRWKGDDQEVSYRFAKYFIRTDKPDDVLRYRDVFLSAERWDVDPVAYAEMAGYLMDRGYIEKIKDLLFKARDANERTPEVHYQLARYFERTEERDQEMLALTKADTYFREQEPLRPRSLAMFIDTQNRIGRHFYEDEEYLSAQERFVEGIDRYEEARERGYLGPSPKFGELYANLGAIDYYVAGDYDSALRNFTLAEENMYSTPELSYRKGYVHYRKEDFGDALLEFYEASEGFSDDPNLMLATANTLYNRRDYFAAQGFYNHVLDILEDRKNRAPFILPQERRDHYELITNLKETHNNIGVTLYNLYKQGGSLDAGKYSQALVHLTRSSEYYDMLTRDPQTLERVDTKNLGYLNQQALLVPMEEAPMELQSYRDIPKDMQG